MMFESEEDKIVRRIKDFMKDEEPHAGFYIMLRNGRILDIDNYYKMVKAGRINPQDAYVYFYRNWTSYRSTFHYSFLNWDAISLDAYLSKLGFHYLPFVFPATGLKYVALVISYKGYLSIEVSNLDIVANNTNLRKITFEVLGDKIISGEKVLTVEEYEKILEKILCTFRSQQLFAGHNVGEADTIIDDYYDKGNQSLAKEVARIAMDYDRIFNPYRVCYETKTWEEVDCWSIKL